MPDISTSASISEQEKGTTSVSVSEQEKGTVSVSVSEQEKGTASQAGGIRSRQGSGSRMYANFSSAITSLRARRRYGLRAISGVFGAAVVVMATDILLYNTNALLLMHLNAQAITLLLVSIGGVSFAVGGFMMMKILLKMGMERAREFGMRLAIGARRCDIRNQLLFEALFLSVAGGVSGSACGLCIGFALTSLLQLPFIVNPVLILLLISASVVPGIVCGLYAVRRVAHLDFYTAATR